MIDVLHQRASTEQRGAPWRRAGRNAAQLMEKCLNGKKMTPQVCIIDPLRIDERGSSNVQATDDKLVVRTLQFIKEHESHAISIQDILSISL